MEWHGVMERHGQRQRNDQDGKNRSSNATTATINQTRHGAAIGKVEATPE